jgi:choline dehydrogenase-like flavoprotein
MTFIDTRTLPDGHVIERDVVIIGSGPAGLAIANELAGGTTRVAILESGGLDYDDDTQALAGGNVVGRPYPDLDTTRLRYFGGTSNHWGGNVKPLDPIDFAARSWIAHSGWPFDHTHMTPYYARAGAFCGLPANAFTPAAWPDGARREPWRFRDDAVESHVFHTVGDDDLRFGETYRERIESAANIDVYLFANVTEIETAASGGAVTGLKIRTLSGTNVEARARSYVLAAGGIENPRLLLLSNRQAPNGLGNDRDLVGRFFMEHLTIPKFVDVFPSDPFVNYDFYRPKDADWGDTWGIIQLSRQVQRAARLPNIRFQRSTIINSFNEHMDDPAMQSLRRLYFSLTGGGIGREEFNRHVANVVADIDTVADVAYQRLRHHPDYPIRWFEFVQIGEQTPNATSRVRLGRQLDRLGQRKVVLDWRVTDGDSAGVARSAEALAKEMGRSGLGRIAQRFPAGVFREFDPQPHYHHMGTTRMASDPSSGVVDADCRLHGVDNLFIAGSSVFPTVGNVNPTLTIIALALRLADHLKGKFRA